jgi:flagellar biosynthesis component FlhA
VYPVYVQSVTSDFAPHRQTDRRVYPQSLFDDHVEIRKLLRLLEGSALVTRHVLRLNLIVHTARHVLRDGVCPQML